MKRGWNTLSKPDERGSQESYQLAQALAAIAEPELLQGLVNVVSSLNEWGGQYMVAAQRERVNVLGQRDPEGEIHVTIGLVHHYKHVPDALKDALREPAPDSLENVEPIDWMEAEGPELDDLTPEQVEHYFGEGDYPSEELRDEIEAEADARAEAEEEAAEEDPPVDTPENVQADREVALAETSE